MKKILFLIPFCMAFLGCNDDKVFFDSKPNVYFPKDKIVFSWFGRVETTMTLNVPCNLVGQTPQTDATYKVIVVKDKTTAVEGVHYEKLPEFFTWERGKFDILVPITIYNTDIQLTQKDFTLTIQLVNGGDLNVNYDGNLTYSVTLSAQVAKPTYWDQYGLEGYFGPYSKIKHSIIVQLLERDFPASVKEYKTQSVYWQNVGLTIVRDYFIENTNIKDENGIVIRPW